MLKRIHLENFLSFKEATLENLQPVNLLIGPNNVGKSNLLKALEFFKEVPLNEMDENQANEEEENKEKQIILNVKEELHFKKIKTSFKIVLNLNELEDITYVSYIIGLSGTLLKKTCDKYRLGQKLGFESYFDKKFDSVETFLENLKIYKPDSNKLTKPFPLLPNNESVSADADNLVAFLDIIQGKFRDNFNAIEKDLKRCIPEFSRIQLDNVEATDELKKIYGDKTFKRLGLYNDSQKITYWADELSEGTLYFLALLCIVHQPNSPKLLLLEEPEKGIHPRRIKEVIDFIFQLSNEKGIQVIMTSHHPYVINEFKDLPEAIYIFDKDEEGATQIKNLQKDVIEPSDRENKEKGLPTIKFTEDLADHWILGFMGGVPK